MKNDTTFVRMRSGQSATGDTGKPQDGQPKEWTARALYIWLRRKKDSGKFTKRVAAKWGLIFQNALSPYQRVWPSFLYSTASTL